MSTVFVPTAAERPDQRLCGLIDMPVAAWTSDAAVRPGILDHLPPCID
jgi:hypothetical protein